MGWIKKGDTISEETKLKLKLGREKYYKELREKKAEMKKLSKLSPERAMAGDDVVQSTIQRGRPLKDISPALAREKVIQEINHSRKEILKAQIEAAKGINYLNKDGATVYTKLPDGQRGEYLLNQLIGKPVESLEIKQITKLQVDI